MELTKVCNKCGNEYTFSNFYKRGDHKGYRSDCKQCISKDNHKNYKRKKSLLVEPMHKDNWLDSLPDNVWIAVMMGMSMLISYVILGGLE